MLENRTRAPWWGGLSPEEVGEFWLDRLQFQWLCSVRAAWGDNVVIQIYGGLVRLRSEEGDLRFASNAELCSAAQRRQPGRSAKY
ncbi:hypothetical protein G3N57_05630 [Paraburkholderia sp. Se-20369]|nr:hypothetical protein [Paraburkholderia sp. Se-20369]